MGKIVFTRIDDRLIHGQVVTGWLKHTRANRIVIVDDGVASDEFMLGILEMAAPPGVPVDVYTNEDAAEILKDVSKENEKILILAKTPIVILDLVKNGVEISHLNVGGMGANPQRKKLYRNIQASKDEIAAMEELEKLGVDVEFRVVVDHKPLSLQEVLNSR